MTEELRCPKCGALVLEGARWCGLCFAPLGASAEEASPEPEATEVAADGAIEGGGAPSDGAATGDEVASKEAVPVWACPTCDNENPIDVEICPACGTAFGELFSDERERPNVSPESATVAGLLPGLGHIKCGLAEEGIARMFAFFASAVLCLLFALSTTGGVASVLLTAFFGLFTLTVWVESVLGARRVAQGAGLMVPGRQILWVFVGLFGLAIALVVFLSVGRPPPQ